MARRKNPYHVVVLKHYDFKDFKEAKIKANTKSQSGQPCKWREMKWIRFTKNEPELCLFKYSFDESEEFQTVKMPGSKQLSKNNIEPLYKGKLPISGAKKKDWFLCVRNVSYQQSSMTTIKGYPSVIVSRIVFRNQT